MQRMINKDVCKNQANGKNWKYCKWLELGMVIGMEKLSVVTRLVEKTTL